MNPTSEQHEIIDAGKSSKSSLFVEALFGCGKTSTAVAMLHAMRETSAIALAFNKKITEELKERVPPWVEVRSFNSVGNSAWSSAIGKRCEVDKDKLYNLVRLYAATEEDREIVRALVTKARHFGLVPKGSQGIALIEDTDANWLDLTDFPAEEKHVEAARKVLRKSIELGYQGTIDYDDQIYLSSLFGGIFRKYKLVVVDEYQDMSLLNIRQVKRLAENRIIVLGDQHQSIYAFRGSDANSSANLRALRDDWIDLKLTETFRCPRAVVRRLNRTIPEFRAAIGNAEGEVREVSGPWYWHQIPRAGTVAILCRNNAPLVGMSFKLARMKVPFKFLGRDSTRSIAALARKILPLKGTPTQYHDIVVAWAAAESASAETAGKRSKIEAIEDRAETLLQVIDACVPFTLREITDTIRHMFNSEGSAVVLATGHGAKGLEFDTVIHLDPWRIPSRFAEPGTSEWVQEGNIRLVIESRTKQTLIVANLSDFNGG